VLRGLPIGPISLVDTNLKQLNPVHNFTAKFLLKYFPVFTAYMAIMKDRNV